MAHHLSQPGPLDDGRHQSRVVNEGAKLPVPQAVPGVLDPDGREVQRIFDGAFQEFGLPAAIR